ncbi:hypothetical protein HYFRA_00006730 [Hymenoscyphus fraxineus]|uniref:phospholipase A2 n=1 Tax=Hymenoscyphus fraxineus TaxID=746836 RepID=A0A9N9KVX2_9HELO|nr:hypothetical protein HYFRA_00006730 [Hymenoscyphus fraxineus]
MSASRQLCLLSLDGGGVRGMSMLFILEEIMKRIDPDSPPKPCDYFDMIGGTSTGGLVAIMLGRLEMSIAECKEAYMGMMEDVFVKTKRRINAKNLKVQGRYDTPALESAIKNVIQSRGISGLDVDSLLLNPEGKCKIFVTSTSKETNKTRCLASYNSPGDLGLPKYTKIWEAGRATSAATTFFDPITIGPYKQTFLDGATGANNPIAQLWNQAKDVWSSDSLESQLRCLISVGTGVPKVIPSGDYLHDIAFALSAIATETEKTAQEFHKTHRALDENNMYFRFNVPSGLEDVGLEETEKIPTIATATNDYLDTQTVHQQMSVCGKLLKEKKESFIYPRLTKEELACLKTLSFDYEARQDAIDTINEETPHWIFRNQDFQQWQARENVSDHHGILCIKGHPGTGKSTVMKHLVTQFNALNTNDDKIILYFYFNARNNVDLEKSSTGLFRALLHQLLKTCPPLSYNVLQVFRERQTHDNWSWHENETRQYFFEALKEKNIKPVTIFIDALDECGTGSNDIVAHFEDAVRHAIQDDRNLNLCISSRHYPNISIPKSKKLNVEDNNQDDLHKYIDKMLPWLNTLVSEGSYTWDWKKDLVKIAGNNFLWIKLVKERLDKMHTGSEATISTIRKELDKVPPNLQDLYKQIMENLQDKERSDMLQIVQWVLLSSRPLTARELRHVMALARTDSSDGQSDQELIQAWESQTEGLINNMEFANLLRTRTKGLVEIIYKSSTEEDLEEFWQGYVQFVHESVRSFFLGDPKAYPAGLLHLKEDLKPSPLGLSHEMILGDILKYLALCRIRSSKEFEEPSALREYAANCLFLHACRAEEFKVHQTHLFDRLYTPSNGEILRSLLSLMKDRKLNLGRKDFSTKTGAANMVFLLASFYKIEGCMRGLLADSNGIAEGVGLDANALLTCQPSPFAEGTYTALMLACLSGHESIVQLLLEKNVNVDIKTQPRFQTALHFAASIGNKKLCDLLLKHGADIEFLDLGAKSPLYYACLYQHPQVVSLLIANGASICTTSEQNIILKFVFSCYKKPVWGKIKSLLKDIPDINHQDSTTPLGLAIMTRQEYLVKRMLKKGAKLFGPKKTIQSDNSPLDTALKCHSLPFVVHIMMKNDLVNLDEVHHTSYKTLLHFAAEVGLTKLVEDLILKKATIDIQDKSGHTPMHYAIENLHMDTVIVLEKKGATFPMVYDVDKRDDNGMTLLHLAVIRSTTNLIQWLLSKKANVASRDTDGHTPFYYARTRWSQTKTEGDLEAIKLLLSAGADIDQRDSHGKTILHWAAIHNTTDFLRWLLSKEAYVRSQDTDGRTPLYYAMARLSGAKGESSFRSVKLLLNAGANIDQRDSDGKTILHWAVHLAAGHGNSDLIQDLISLKASVNIPDRDGNTPVYYATQYSNTEVIKVLEDALSPEMEQAINTRSGEHNKTKLHWAAEDGNYALVQSLLDRNANLMIRDRYGETPLHYAAENEHFKVVVLLVDAGASLSIKDRSGRRPLECTRRGRKVFDYLSWKMKMVQKQQARDARKDMEKGN